jgi:maleate cis-trans isomerase
MNGTIEYIAKLEVIIGIPIVTSNLGGQYTPADERGTWAIKQVAIKFACLRIFGSRCGAIGFGFR